MIQLENVTKSYPTDDGDIVALQDINLSVAEGELVIVRGASGSGKTTLLNIIGALDSPTSGAIVVEGLDVGQASDGELSAYRARKVGFIFQAYHIDPTQTVLGNVMIALLSWEERRSEKRKLAMAALGEVGLGEQARHRAAVLSAGEKRRLTVARALVKRPAIVLADEPTANLDEANAAEILRLIRTSNEAGSTVVLVTHEKGTGDIAGRAIALRDGRLVPSVSSDEEGR